MRIMRILPGGALDDITVNVTELKDRYGELLRHVERGGTVYIKRREQIIAVLRRVDDKEASFMVIATEAQRIIEDLTSRFGNDKQRMKRELRRHIQASIEALGKLDDNGDDLQLTTNH